MALHVMEEASRCLGCKKPRCREGCPIHTNIPEVIRLLKENRLNEAGWMLFENNPLTTVCEYMQSLPMPKTTDYPDAPTVETVDAAAQAEQVL